MVVDPAQLKMFAALPDAVDSQKNPITEAKVNLGRMLYYDPRLSKNQDVSCNTCHDLAKYGVDGQPVSDGEKGQKGTAQRPYGIQRRGPLRAVLGWPRPRCGGTGQGPDDESGRDGECRLIRLWWRC